MKKQLLYASGIWLLSLLILVSFTTIAQNVPQIKNQPFSKQESNVDDELIKLQKEVNNAQRKGGNFQPNNKYLQVYNGYVVVDITAKDNAQKLSEELKKLGMKNVSVYGRVISGYLPVSSINKLQKNPDIRFARPAYKPKNNIGSVTSQGDTAQRSHIARKKYKVTGKDVKVGVLSDTYNARKGARQMVLSGDLPGKGNPRAYRTEVHVLEDDTVGSDEGRAMLEIVHDVSPAARLAFHTAFRGQAGFANGILKLAKAKCDVIVDDVIYFFEPFFQDGIVAQAVDEVAKKGVTYLSSAGNQGRASYEAPFKSSGIEPFGPEFGPAHDFGGGDILQKISIPAGGSLLMILQWDDPFYSVSGKGAESDIDIFLLNAAGDSILSGSAEINLGDDPVEGFYFENTGGDAEFNIMITKAAGPSPKVIKYVEFEGWATIEEYDTKSSTSYGHANAKGAIAVGAARYNRTPEYGVNPPRIEGFSSAGGTKIYFDVNGNRIKRPELRYKPEITAPNGGNSTFFGFDYEGDGYPNFFGTSASAPHAAGVAALVLDATDKSSKTQVLWALQHSAIDMDDPATSNFDYGHDFVSGYGLIQADKAVEAALRGRQMVKYLLLTPVCSSNPNEERRWKIKNPNTFSVAVTASVLNGEVKYVNALPGDTYFTTKTVSHLNLVFINWKDENNRQKLIANVSFGETCPTSSSLARTSSEEISLEAEASSVISASPNPVKDKLKLRLINLELQDVKVSLHNSQGNKVYEQKFDPTMGEDEINMGALPKGMYFLKVRHQQYNKVIKVLKE